MYIQMYSIHGLVRSENPELGRDADTGGQITYVIELVKHLSQRDDIDQVDLFTRLIEDPSVSNDYAQPIEPINEKSRIVRIQCGGKKYMRKELLWPYLDEYIDKTIKFIKRQNKVPDIVHGHYADAGYVAVHLSRIMGIPFVFTGHSLGIPKKNKLLNDGMDEADIIKKYRIDKRISVEEKVLTTADLIITSTNQEIKEQYGLYDNSNHPQYSVIPPGIGIDRYYPYYHDLLPESEKTEEEKYAQATLMQQLERFLTHPSKPLVLAISRPDKRKNISGLIKTYGEDTELKAMADLAIFAGIRKDIDTMEENEKSVLTEMLLLMDRYDLYGKMAIPKKHNFEYEIPELYRIVAQRQGVFINPALTEPFGMTLLEASAIGLPIVATNDGGPKDIINNCKNGILVDTTSSKDMASALKNLLSDKDLWEKYSKNGIMNVRKYYTWDSHAENYSKKIRPLIKAKKKAVKIETPASIGKQFLNTDYFLITDIDNTLIGKKNEYLEELLAWLKNNEHHFSFGVATGRTVDSAVEVLKSYNIDLPDLIISSVGTEIYYGAELEYDQGWETHIAKRWDRDKIEGLLSKLDFLSYQEESTQRKFKVSYNMAPGKDRIARIHDLLKKNKCRYTLIYSHGQFLDIIPYRASKGKAIRYMSYKWETPLSHFIVCGDSGNDEEMLRGESRGIVVANYSPEIEKLKGARRIYFAKLENAGGILEGLAHYQFIEMETLT